MIIATIYNELFIDVNVMYHDALILMQCIVVPNSVEELLYHGNAITPLLSQLQTNTVVEWNDLVDFCLSSLEKTSFILDGRVLNLIVRMLGLKQG